MTGVRVGCGWDIHPLVAGRKLILGGLEILQRQGYDPKAFADPLHVIDEAGRAYVPYSAEALAKAGFPPFAA